MTTDLPGFDPDDSSTWHPAHRTLTAPMQRVARMLDVRLGANLAPAIEYLARELHPAPRHDEAATRDEAEARVAATLADPRLASALCMLADEGVTPDQYAEMCRRVDADQEQPADA